MRRTVVCLLVFAFLAACETSTIDPRAANCQRFVDMFVHGDRSVDPNDIWFDRDWGVLGEAWNEFQQAGASDQPARADAALARLVEACREYLG